VVVAHGPLNAETINLFKAVEVPQELVVDGETPVGPQDSYSSIGAFYDNLLDGLSERWDSLYPENASYEQLNQYGAQFYSAYTAELPRGLGVCGIPEDALLCVADILHLIIMQGEGGAASKSNTRVYDRLKVKPPKSLPRLRLKRRAGAPDGSAHLKIESEDPSHFELFSAISQQLDEIEVQAVVAGATNDTEPEKLKTAYTNLINAISKSYDSTNWVSTGEPSNLASTNLSSMWDLTAIGKNLWHGNGTGDAGVLPQWVFEG
jgi:hypothetical protein